MLAHTFGDLIVSHPELGRERVIGLCLLDRIEILALHVLDQRQLQHLPIVDLPDHRRDRLEPCEARCTQAAFACHELISVSPQAASWIFETSSVMNASRPYQAMLPTSSPGTCSTSMLGIVRVLAKWR